MQLVPGAGAICDQLSKTPVLPEPGYGSARRFPHHPLPVHAMPADDGIEPLTIGSNRLIHKPAAHERQCGGCHLGTKLAEPRVVGVVQRKRASASTSPRSIAAEAVTSLNVEPAA